MAKDEHTSMPEKSYLVEVNYAVYVTRLVEVKAECAEDALDEAEDTVRRDPGMVAGFNHHVVIHQTETEADQEYSDATDS